MSLNLFRHLPPPLLDSLLPRLITTRSCSTTTTTSAPPRPIKLRFAPSPTGHLHLGGLRTALYNHLLARKLGGSWALRIEDTDQTRYVEGAVESLLRTLRWSKLEYDEGPDKDAGNGPYYQSQRKEIYNHHLEPLISSGKAYHCFCSPSRLTETRKRLQKNGSNMGYDRKCLGLSKEEREEKLNKGEKSIVRFKSSSKALTQTDLVYASIHYDSLPLEDFVLRKSDGLPTYHFANVVDDHTMGITHVLRGEEWLPSTPKHLALYEALGLEPPLFAHLPLLINPDGSKLSKRAGDVRVEDYIERGYEPEALLNFVALLGWSPQGPSASSKAGTATPASETDILTLPALISSFSLEAVNKNRATMSIAKLQFLNRAHVQLKLVDQGKEGAKGREEMVERLRGKLKELGVGDDKTLATPYLISVIDALKERLHTIYDIPTLGASFFSPPDLDSEAAKALFSSVSVEAYRSTLSSTLSFLSIPSNPLSSLLPFLTHTTPEEGGTNKRSTKEIMTPLRHCLTGLKVGAGVRETVETLGREETMRRVREGLRRLDEM